MDNIYCVNYYRGISEQKVRNLSVLSVSLIWIEMGDKAIYTPKSIRKLDTKKLLLLPLRSILSFENTPHNGHFLSTQINFFDSPPDRLINCSHRNQHKILENDKCPKTITTPSVQVVNFSQQTREICRFLAEKRTFSYLPSVQRQLCYSLYQQLAEEGLLHLLFIQQKQFFYQRVLAYISDDLSTKHTIHQVSEYFAMSKSTLIRKLKLEGVTFKQLLLDARMNHALSLMQSGIKDQLELSLLCGYLSHQRFTKQFEQSFGLSIKKYMSTVGVLK